MLTILSLFLCVAAGLLFQPTTAWWDETHMVIGRIAEKQLNQSQVDKLNAYLGVWEHNYPGLSTVATATIFGDHIRCVNRTRACEGFPFTEAFNLFNNTHFYFNPYNPQNLSEEMVIKPRPSSIEGMGSIFNAVKIQVEGMIANPCTKESCPFQVGSDMSWNILLRMFLHLYGDLHCPSHHMYGMSKYYPTGDYFSIFIPLGWPVAFFDGEYRPQYNDFHHYTDSIGNRENKMWPNEYTMEDVERRANNYIEKYPFESYDASLKNVDPWDSDTMSQESYNMQRYFYDLFDYENFNPANCNKLYLTEAMDKEMKDMLEARVVLAGYRLGHALVKYAAALPDIDATFHSQVSKGSKTTTQNKDEL